MRPRSEILLNGLARALSFGAPELYSNRTGLLHQNQLTRFANEYLLVPILGILMGILTPVFFRFIWASVVEQRELWHFAASVMVQPSKFFMQIRFGVEEPFPAVVEMGYIVFPLIIIHYLMRIPWPLAADLISRKVGKETGLVCVRWDEKRLKGKKGREGDLVSRYSYFINGHEYRVCRAAYEALAPQIEYNLYYLIHSKIVTSVEPLDVATHNVQAGERGLKVIKTK